MYYTRKPSDPDPATRYNAGRILQLLNHLPFLDNRNIDTIKALLEDPARARALIDVSSAVLAQLAYRRALDIDRILLAASEFAHQSIIARGYTFEPIPEELKSAVRDQRVDILVAGAQARPIFQSRVDECIRILKELDPFRPNITFSGSNPHTAAGAQQLDEAAEMIGYFRLKQRTDHTFPQVDFKIIRESRATNTIGNIKNFFTANPLAPGECAHLVVVSSLFHLPRFMDEVEQFREHTKLNLSQVTFVSAEEGVTEVVEFMREARYVKSCMFELYNAIIRDHEADRLLRPSSYLG